MNYLLRTLISRQTPALVCRRQLASDKQRRAFRTPTLIEKFRSSQPSSPRSNNQRPFGFINEKNVILGIIAVNGAVFITWRFAYANLRSNHDQRLLWFMTKNFSMSVLNCRRKRTFPLFSGIMGWSRAGKSCLDIADLSIQSF